VLAGEELTINGSGFSAVGGETQVIVRDSQNREYIALVTEATANQLRVRVPFGAGSGQVSVRTPQGETENKPPLNYRTSVSGFIEETFTQANGQLGRRPIPNVTLRARPLLPPGPMVTQRTGNDGSFVLADVTAGAVAIDVDPSTTNVPYPARTFRLLVQPNRDNQYVAPIELQASQQTNANSVAFNAGQNGGAMVTINQGSPFSLNFGVPNNCQVTAPPNSNANRFTVALFDPERVPATMPAGYFSTAIAQISPFGARMSPGGTLRLPNPDNIPSGTTVKLFRFDQPTQSTPDTATTGSFVEVGTGQLVNGLIVANENSSGFIAQSSYYFASPVYQTARVNGRVLTSDGLPAARALVSARGQSVFTNSDGTFALENIPVIKSGDAVTLEVSFMRPDRIVDRTQRGPLAITANGFIALDTAIVLSGRLTADQPLVLAPPRLTVNENQTLDFDFLAVSQTAGGTMQVAVTANGVNASVAAQGNDVYRLRLSASGNSVGEYTALVTATSSTGAKFIHSVAVRVRRPTNLPTANDQSVVTNAGTPRNVTLTGSDPLGRAITLLVITSPANGSIGGSLPNAVYTPQGGFRGLDAFQYRANVNNSSIIGENSTVYVIVR
jgi:hypothetical protein